MELGTILENYPVVKGMGLLAITCLAFAAPLYEMGKMLKNHKKKDAQLQERYRELTEYNYNP